VTGADLALDVARLGRTLRGAGLGVSLTDEIDAAAALHALPRADRAEVRCALRIALKIRRRDWERFDALLEAALRGAEPVPSGALERSPRAPATPARRPITLREPEPGGAAEGEGAGEGGGALPGYSPEALLRHKPFEACTPDDLAAMERLLARLAARLATRRSRRLVPTRGGGVPDLRRSLRRAVSTGGELLALARRARPVERPRLVVLCDTSGSMDPHARFLLAFVLSLRRAARATEVFAFNTSLVRLTPWLARGAAAATLDRLAASVPDWAGGTRIGESLDRFVADHLHERVDARTVVLILSDGLDRGDVALLARAMRAIRSRARKVIWLNPLLGDPRYEPTARGMEAALPFVDQFLPAHDLASLERLLPHLSA
jgi:uncharacterized protein with von Willebrand factor type A (vWA) domain